MLRQREIINNFCDIISQHHVAQPQVISIYTGTVKEPLLTTLKKTNGLRGQRLYKLSELNLISKKEEGITGP